MANEANTCLVDCIVDNRCGNGDFRGDLLGSPDRSIRAGFRPGANLRHSHHMRSAVPPSEHDPHPEHLRGDGMQFALLDVILHHAHAATQQHVPVHDQLLRVCLSVSDYHHHPSAVQFRHRFDQPFVLRDLPSKGQLQEEMVGTDLCRQPVDVRHAHLASHTAQHPAGKSALPRDRQTFVRFMPIVLSAGALGGHVQADHDRRRSLSGVSDQQRADLPEGPLIDPSRATLAIQYGQSVEQRSVATNQPS